MLKFRLECLARAGCLFAVSLFVVPLIAQVPQPAGPSLQVNTLSDSSPSRVQVAWRCEADVTLVVWDSVRSAGVDDDGRSIQGRFFSGLTPTGPQFQVNQTIVGEQSRPMVQVLDSGEFTVAWYSVDAKGERTVKTRSYNRTTLAPGPERTFGQNLPRIDDVDVAADGRVALAWWEGQFIFSQIYDAAGQPLGVPLSAELTETENVAASGRVTLGDDLTVLQWAASEEIFEPDFEIRSRFAFQRFLPDGSPTGPETTVASGVFCGIACGGSFGNVLTHLEPDGEFVVTYLTISYPDNVQYDIWASRSAPDGASTLFTNVVSSYAYEINNVSLAGEADEDFLVVWNDSAADAFGKRFASDATDAGPAFSIYDRPPHFTSTVDVSYSGPGSPFAAAWNDQTNVYWRRFLSYPGMLEDGFESGDASRWCVARSGQ